MRQHFILMFVGASIFAKAFHWFITPIAHPDAGVFLNFAVGAQAVAGALLFWFGYRQWRRVSAKKSEDEIALNA